MTLFEYSNKKKDIVAIITKPDAKPSKPSIQLNAFTSDNPKYYKIKLIL